jgi:hypothetical protein
MGEFGTGPENDTEEDTDKDQSWPFVLKPRWIHELLLLWRRKQPYEPYLEQVCDYSVRELRDKAMRRRCVAWIANRFAPSRAAATMTQNVWASYSHHFRVADLAPVYLASLVMSEPLARRVICSLHGQLTPGHALGRSVLAGIKAAPGATESLLRTLQQWEVLEQDPRNGGYLAGRRMVVSLQTFPLLVWVWWLHTRQPSVSLTEFCDLPMWTWIDTDCFAVGWEGYVGRLWTLETNGGDPTLFFHPTDPAGFTRSLLNLLSTDGRSGRQLPRHEERSDAYASDMQMREGIFGR